MLSQTSYPVASGATLPAWYGWYKVLAASDAVQSSGNWVRSVTLAGPDWNPNPVDKNNSQIPTFASIFDGVIGVYERDMEIEASGSPWSPN